MFQGLRQNSLIYVLEKTDKGLSLRTGQVTNVSNPQPKYGQFVPNTEMLVDIKVKLDGEESAEFKQLPASGSIANSGNVVVSDSSEAMCAEVDGMLRISQQVIDSVPYHETILASGDAVKRQLNPRLAKEKEQEEKIGALEEKMDGIEDTLNNMMGMLSKALSKKEKEA